MSLAAANREVSALLKNGENVLRARTASSSESWNACWASSTI